MAPRPNPPTKRGDPLDVAEELSERRSRSLEEPLDLRLARREPFPLVEVRNPLHRTAYLVMLPTFPDRSVALCTCADFARRGLGTCKHIEAVERWLPNHPEAKPPAPTKPGPRTSEVWKEIDRRVERSTRGSAPESLRVREAGAVLFETPA